MLKDRSVRFEYFVYSHIKYNSPLTSLEKINLQQIWIQALLRKYHGKKKVQSSKDCLKNGN